MDTRTDSPDVQGEKRAGLTRITREKERSFFFYATVAAAILWAIGHILKL